MDHATYADGRGHELRFRPAQQWEYRHQTKLVYDLVAPGGRTLWGIVAWDIAGPDRGALFSECVRPGPEDASLTDMQIEACRVWDNVVYALDGRIYFLPGAAEPAVPALILVNIGAALGEVPLGEIGDQFMFKGCAS